MARLGRGPTIRNEGIRAVTFRETSGATLVDVDGAEIHLAPDVLAHVLVAIDRELNFGKRKRLSLREIAALLCRCPPFG